MQVPTECFWRLENLVCFRVSWLFAHVYSRLAGHSVCIPDPIPTPTVSPTGALALQACVSVLGF